MFRYVCTTGSVHASVSFCMRWLSKGVFLYLCVCGQKGDCFKGWQESRAEIKSLNCYIFHLHLLFYGGWGPPRDSACDSWTLGRPASSAIPHRHPAARVPKAPHTITLMTMNCFCCCLLLFLLFFVLFFLRALFQSLSETNNLEFVVHPSLVRAEPSEAGRGSRYTQIGTHGKEEREIQIRER